MGLAERIGNSTVFLGDCREVMATLATWGTQVDSIVCDPPYHLTSVVNRFGGEDAAPAKSNGATGVYARASAGFMGKTWDGGDIAFRPETWRLAYNILKPGGYIAAFGGTRTYHRLAVAIEDAGFDIRDLLFWCFGTGFPKSLDVSKAIDKALGVKGTYGDPKTAAHASWIERGTMRGGDGNPGHQRPWMDDPDAVANAARQYIPGSDEAAEWSGWGTALKPSVEPIVLARKPFQGTVAANVLAHRTGGLHIDACRVETGGRPVAWATPRGGIWATDELAKSELVTSEKGRWPANLLHDGSPEVLEAFAAYGESESRERTGKRSEKPHGVLGAFAGQENVAMGHTDSGTAARFFYAAKASASERVTHCNDCGWRVLGRAPKSDDSKTPHCPSCGSTNLDGHPTVKPQALMQWLARLITPPGGTVLDPFAGSGSTGAAATAEGFKSLLIEADLELWCDSLVKLPGVRHGGATW